MAATLLYSGANMNLARLLSIVTLVAAFAAPLAADPRHAKLDEPLRRTVERGCTGKKSVIVRTKPGYREGLRNSLAAHGDVVKGEFPALDAIAAEVHCDDLVELAGFGSTASVSENVTCMRSSWVISRPERRLRCLHA